MPQLNTTVIALVILFGSIGLSNVAKAQDGTTITLEQAINTAKENYPSIKASSMEVERQKSLKATGYDLGKTSISTGKEEVGNGTLGIQNNVGISQTEIDLFAIPAKIGLAGSRIGLAESQQQLTEKMLERDVSLAWFSALSSKKQLQLYLQLDSIYTNFLKAAELRYKTQATSKVEFLSATAKYQELMVNIKQAQSRYDASLQQLNQYLLFSQDIDIAVPESDWISDLLSLQPTASLKKAPILNLYENQVKVSNAEWKAEKANLFPKIDLGYTMQSVDGQSGFYGWKAGISVPLLFFSQAGKNKASRINYQISELRYQQKELEINAVYRELFNRYKSIKEVLNYYKTDALPLADEQITAANLGYRLGSLDYVQFIQNMESAINTRREYLSRLAEYYEIKEQLKYIIGQ